MVDPMDVLKCVCAVVTFAYKHGPTHRLDKADNHLSSVLDAIEDHRGHKPPQEVKRLLEEYDMIQVLVESARAAHTSRPVYLKITPKVMRNVGNVKKKSKDLLTSAKRSSDAAKRRALLEPTTVTDTSSSGRQEAAGPSILTSVLEGTEVPAATLVAGSAERLVSLTMNDQGMNVANTPHDEEVSQLVPTMRFTTTLGTLERCCPGIIDQIYVPAGTPVVDESPLVINVTTLVFADILQQVAAGVASLGIVDEDYLMEDATRTTV